MPTDPTSTPARGLTVADIARRYRVSPDRVRAWIRRGELAAVNTRDVRCGRPRFVVTQEALDRFERGRAAVTTPKPQRRRRRQTEEEDFYPD